MDMSGLADLQGAVFARLQADAGVQARLPGAVHDALPSGALPETYAVIGPERMRIAADADGAVARSDLTIRVHSTAAGFAQAKGAAVAIAQALAGAEIDLGGGVTAALGLRWIRAERTPDGAARRVDVTVRALVGL